MTRSALARLHEIVPLKAIFVPMAAEKAELQQLRSEHSRPRSSGWRHSTSVPRRGSPTFRDRQAAGARRFGRSSEKLERAQQAFAFESRLGSARLSPNSRPQDRKTDRRAATCCATAQGVPGASGAGRDRHPARPMGEEALPQPIVQSVKRRRPHGLAKRNSPALA